MHGFYERALELFYMMQELQVSPGRCTFLCILKVCGYTEALIEGQAVHDQIVTHGLESDISVGSSLIEMYAKCGNIEESCKVFDTLQSKDLISWSVMIAAFSQNSQSMAALELYRKMVDEGFKPDRAVFLCLLKACGALRVGWLGRMLHEQIVENMLEDDSLLCSSLIDMYSKCSNMEDAQSVFDSLRSPDVIAWNALMAGYGQHGCWLHTLNLFHRMHLCGIEPDTILLSSILRAFQDSESFQNATIMHISLIFSGFDSKLLVQELLVSMYVTCGALEDGNKIFETMLERSVSAWNTIFAGLIQHNMPYDVIQTHERMLLEHVQTDSSALVNVLKACSKLKNLWQGKVVHTIVNLCDLNESVVIGNAVIDVYVKCQCMEMAHQVFETLRERNLVTWNTLIAGYAYNRQDHIVLGLLQAMQEEGFAPDDFTYASIMKPCGDAKALGFAHQIHEKIVAFGFEATAFVGSIIIDTYSKCGCMDEALDVFEKLPCKDVVCWNTLIGAQAQLGNEIQALELFEKMQEDQVCADKMTYLCILKVCSTLLAGLWQQIMLLHHLILVAQLELDIFLGTALIDSYAKNSDLGAARKVFDSLSCQNVVTWGSMISGYLQHGEGLSALDMTCKMISEGLKPEKSTFLAAIKACISTGAVKHGRLIHDSIIRDGFELNLEICSAVINFYGKCGSLQEALRVFRNLPCQDLVCFNALISGYGHHGDKELAEQSFEELQTKCVNPISETYINVLKSFSHIGLVEEGEKWIKNMNINKKSLIQYTSVIDLFGRAGHMEEAVEVLKTMPDLPDVAVWLVFLTACKMYGNPQLAKDCFDQLSRLDLSVAAGYMLMSDICADSQTSFSLDDPRHNNIQAY
ncbi:hypothetical protein KP509_35G047100 [Ceratopteris richardii]|nr:hypothetical protein KP509_35G047100 [Ceratopteris richardii]